MTKTTLTPEARTRGREKGIETKRELRKKRIKIAHEMRTRGLSNAEIAKELRVRRETVGRYLKEPVPADITE